MSLSSTDDFEVETCESIDTELADGERRDGRRGSMIMGGDGLAEEMDDEGL